MLNGTSGRKGKVRNQPCDTFGLSTAEALSSLLGTTTWATYSSLFEINEIESGLSICITFPFHEVHLFVYTLYVYIVVIY